jgi:hypothetical protein
MTAEPDFVLNIPPQLGTIQTWARRGGQQGGTIDIGND